MSLTRRDLLRSLGTVAMAGAATRVSAWPGNDLTWTPQAAARPSFVPDVEFEITAAPGEARILPGAPTKVWSFRGRVLKGPASSLQPIPNSYLGPTLRVRRGQKVRVRFLNRLPDASIIHWHGLDVPQEADGHPRLAVPGGAEYIYEFE